MRKIVLFCVMLFSFAFGQHAHALMFNVQGVKGVPSGTHGWITDSAGCSVPQASSAEAIYKGSSGTLSSCTFNQPVSWGNNAFIPVEGSWYLFPTVCSQGICSGGMGMSSEKNRNYIRTDRSVGSQNLDWGGSTYTRPIIAGGDQISMCFYITNNINGLQSLADVAYIGDASSEPWCPKGSYKPMPPTPSVNTCSINNDNPVTVDMGEINRAEISTAAGSGEVKHKSIPVWCYSDSGFSSMPVNLQFSYTPTTFADGKAIQSSVPGVGISVGYDSKILVSNEVLNLNLPIGDSNMDFTFEAIRDSGVAVTDIETGPFTASGVLIMSLP